MQVAQPIRSDGCVTRRVIAAASLLLAMLWPASAAALFIVNEPWIRPAAAGGDAQVYVVLISSDGASLVGARADVARRVLIEEPDGTGRGKFRAVARLPLPAGQTVMLTPTSERLRMLSIERALKLGDRVALVLIIEAADGTTQEIPVSAEVRRRSPTDDEMHAHEHGRAPHATTH